MRCKLPPKVRYQSNDATHKIQDRTNALSKMSDLTHYSPVQEHNSKKENIQQSAVTDTMTLSLKCNVLAWLCEDVHPAAVTNTTLFSVRMTRLHSKKQQYLQAHHFRTNGAARKYHSLPMQSYTYRAKKGCCYCWSQGSADGLSAVAAGRLHQHLRPHP